MLIIMTRAVEDQLMDHFARWVRIIKCSLSVQDGNMVHAKIIAGKINIFVSIVEVLQAELDL